VLNLIRGLVLDSGQRRGQIQMPGRSLHDHIIGHRAPPVELQPPATALWIVTL
jgi:hypothetical protein